MKSVIIFGAGGHGKVVADVIERQNEYEIIGFLDDMAEFWGREVYGYKVVGGFDNFIDGRISRCPVIIAVGDNQVRKQLAERIQPLNCGFISAVHPSSQISRDVKIEPGTVIMANVAVNPGSNIGAHAILNTGASIDHDCVIGDFVHISPAAVLAGNVTVEENTHIGMGSSILPGIKIGANCVIGAGTVVTRDIPPGLTVVGIPGRPVKKTEFDVVSAKVAKNSY